MIEQCKLRMKLLNKLLMVKDRNSNFKPSRQIKSNKMEEGLFQIILYLLIQSSINQNS